MAIAQVKPGPALKEARRAYDEAISNHQTLNRRLETQEAKHEQCVAAWQKACAEHEHAVGSCVHGEAKPLGGSRSAVQEAAGDVRDSDEVLKAIRVALEASEAEMRERGNAFRRAVKHAARDAVAAMQDRVESNLRSALEDFAVMWMMAGDNWGGVEVKAQRMLSSGLFKDAAEVAKANIRELEALSQGS